ncbi:recombination directionality factor, partial [Herbaspirillum chlorophenolicum]|uniref:recombination directionality factor n=1 Tax=Herbaspirillum chlorophenolicum TaxID=211589 RepID=UPI00067C8A75
MLKGLAITPPVVGRISIGRVIERNGKRLPEKDDQFTLTTQIQSHDGWMLHPLDETMRKAASNGKLRAIPVRVMFNDPDLNLRAEYSAFDKETGRPVCVGNGDTCRRAVNNGIETLPCPSPDACAFGAKLCKPYARLNVIIGEDDELGSFIFRTTSFNSIRTLAARLNYYHAVSGGLLATMPLELKLRGKSTTQSYRTAIYYVDLVVQSEMSLEGAIAQARELADRKKAAGFDQTALDEAARLGFANGAFEDYVDDASDVVEEFYPAQEDAGNDDQQPTARKTS